MAFSLGEMKFTGILQTPSGRTDEFGQLRIEWTNSAFIFFSLIPKGSDSTLIGEETKLRNRWEAICYKDKSIGQNTRIKHGDKIYNIVGVTTHIRDDRFLHLTMIEEI